MHRGHIMPTIARLLIAGAVALLTTAPAAAIDKKIGYHMVEGRISVPPRGFKQFCITEKDHCEIYRRAKISETIDLNALRYQELVKVNSSVNAEIQPIPENFFFASKDNWKLPLSSGDCEDFVLLKQARLIEMGWPASALLITVVDMQDGTRHAVLTVRTDSGDLILDNVTDKVLDWQNVNYRWIKRQSARKMMRWVKIKKGEVPLNLSAETRSRIIQGQII